MKKLTMSVAALTIAMMSYGQAKVDSIVPMKEGVYLTKYEVWDMMGDLEDMLEWISQDKEGGCTHQGDYEEGWGNEYWLTLMLEKLEEIASNNAEKWRK
tara:strand:- start:408 stop:704 length:297 start_codon:yes stop_codon:yes gene_type:complete